MKPIGNFAPSSTQDRGPGHPIFDVLRDACELTTPYHEHDHDILTISVGDLEAILETRIGAYDRQVAEVIDRIGDDIKVLRTVAEEWRSVAMRAGVCMSCALGAPEPYGCTDCLNTGWCGGKPTVGP